MYVIHFIHFNQSILFLRFLYIYNVFTFILDKVSLLRPYYFEFHISNFALSGINIYLRNVSGVVLMNKYVYPGETNAIFQTILLYEVFPLYHYMEASLGGNVASINGVKKLKLIPTAQQVKIPIYVSAPGMLIPIHVSVFILFKV